MRFISLLIFFVIFEFGFSLEIEEIIDYRLKRLLRKIELDESLTVFNVWVNYPGTEIQYFFSDLTNRHNFYNFTEQDVSIYEEYCNKKGHDTEKHFALDKFTVNFEILCEHLVPFAFLKFFISVFGIVVCGLLVLAVYGMWEKRREDKIERDNIERSAEQLNEYIEQDRRKIAKNYPDRIPVKLPLI